VLAHRRATRAGIRLAGASEWTRRNFARWMFEDYPRALLATPRRWHRGMFHPSAAYSPTGSDTETVSGPAPR
jgi:hypothetical protein